MISFNNINDKDTEYKISFGDGKHIDLFLHTGTTLTNKFEIIISSIQKMSEVLGNNFDNFIYCLLSDYQQCDSDEYRYNLLSECVRNIADFANIFVENNDIDYAEFTDKSKKGDSSIFFDENEIKKIIKLSEALKIYSLFSNSESKLSDEYHKKIYNDILGILEANSSFSKIFKLLEVLKLQSIKTIWRDYKDLPQWSFIKFMEVYNIITNSQIIVCKYDQNPIPFFIEIFNNIAKYRNKFKEYGIVYEDDDNSQNDQSHNFLSDKNIKIDLKKLAGKEVINILYQISFNYLTDLCINRSKNVSKEKDVIKLKGRINQIEYISPFWGLIIAPILSSAIGVEHKQILKQSPKKIAVISFYLENLLKSSCNNKFDYLFNLSGYYPISQIPESTTYRLLNISHFINSTLNFPINNIINVGGSRINLVRMIEDFIGKMKTGTIKYCSILTGQQLNKQTDQQLEHELISFLCRYFTGNLETEINKFKEIIENEILGYEFLQKKERLLHPTTTKAQ
jgi:hypothetical protein